MGEIKIRRELRIEVGLRLRLIFVVMGLSMLLCALEWVCQRGFGVTVLLGLMLALLHRSRMCLSASLL